MKLSIRTSLKSLVETIKKFSPYQYQKYIYPHWFETSISFFPLKSCIFMTNLLQMDNKNANFYRITSKKLIKLRKRWNLWMSIKVQIPIEFLHYLFELWRTTSNTIIQNIRQMFERRDYSDLWKVPMSFKSRSLIVKTM